MMRHSGKKYFEDISIGDCAESGEQTVDREEMLEFARRYDPQYFHTDPEAAKASVFGEVVASGLFTAVLWRRLDHEISGDIAWICGVAWKDTRIAYFCRRSFTREVGVRREARVVERSAPRRHRNGLPAHQSGWRHRFFVS